MTLRIRPPRLNSAECTYTEKIAKLLPCCHVKNLSVGASLVPYQNETYDLFVREFPDFIIVNYGVVDACTRSIPRWLYNFIERGNPSDNFVIRGIRETIQYFESRFRRNLVLLRGKKSWNSSRSFERKYTNLVKFLKRETKAVILCLSINPVSNRIEKQLPGSRKRTIEFNSIIKKICLQENAIFINTSDIISQDDVPDGIHFNADGHEKIASEIVRIIDSYTHAIEH